jgi:hypothetical protein
MQAASADNFARKNWAHHVSTAGSWHLEDFKRFSSKDTESLPIGATSILKVSLYLSVRFSKLRQCGSSSTNEMIHLD